MKKKFRASTSVLRQTLYSLSQLFSQLSLSQHSYRILPLCQGGGATDTSSCSLKTGWCWVMADKWAKLLNIWLPGGLIDALFIHLGPRPANISSVRQLRHATKCGENCQIRNIINRLVKSPWPDTDCFRHFQSKWFRNEGLYINSILILFSIEFPLQNY